MLAPSGSRKSTLPVDDSLFRRFAALRLPPAVHCTQTRAVELPRRLWPVIQAREVLNMPGNRLALFALAALAIATLPAAKADCCYRYFLNCVPDLYVCGDCTPVQGDWCGESSCFLGQVSQPRQRAAAASCRHTTDAAMTLPWFCWPPLALCSCGCTCREGCPNNGDPGLISDSYVFCATNPAPNPGPPFELSLPADAYPEDWAGEAGCCASLPPWLAEGTCAYPGWNATTDGYCPPAPASRRRRSLLQAPALAPAPALNSSTPAVAPITRPVCQGVGSITTPEGIGEVFTCIDANCDGRLDFEETCTRAATGCGGSGCGGGLAWPLMAGALAHHACCCMPQSDLTK